MSFSTEARKILVLLFGIANIASGGFLLWRIMQTPPIDRHLVYVFVAWIAVGALIVAPRVLLEALKKLAGLLPSIKIGTP